MAISVLVALRSKRLRRRNCAKLVWLFVSPTLSADEPRPVKVLPTADALGLKRVDVRRALRLLTRLRFLHCTKAATEGTPGEYVLGPRALQVSEWTPPAGTLGGPVRPLNELPLFRDVA
ncbi:MAG: hypothetical protein K2Y26_00135 [Gemmatimonadaceae bacterium]|nr:hypothetical protein [Gemmatimonadaceae bacterium]